MYALMRRMSCRMMSAPQPTSFKTLRTLEWLAET